MTFQLGPGFASMLQQPLPRDKAPIMGSMTPPQGMTPAAAGGGFFDRLLKSGQPIAEGVDRFVKDNPGLLAGIAHGGAQPGATVASTLAGGTTGLLQDRANSDLERRRQDLIDALRGNRQPGGAPNLGFRPARPGVFK